MADGSSNPEIDLGLGKVSEVSQEQLEQFQEQMAQAQAALQKLQKEEGKAKKRDYALANLLSRFVKSNQDQDVLKLIVICLNIDIPVNFIVAILSIGYQEIQDEINLQLKKDPPPSLSEKEEKKFMDGVEKEEGKLESKQAFDEKHLPDEVKKRINEWVRDILLLSLENKKKMLETVYEQNMPRQTPLELSTKMLERYLLTANIEGSFERIKTFSDYILKGIEKELQKAK
jgi:flavodoxin